MPAETLSKLPNNYALAVESGRFATQHDFDPARNYLPPTLLSGNDDWQEIDFYQRTAPRMSSGGMSSCICGRSRDALTFASSAAFPAAVHSWKSI